MEDKDLSTVIANLDGVAQNYGTVVVVAVAVVGVLLAGYSAMKLHAYLMHHNDWVDHQGGAGGYVLGIVIGGFLTISAVVVGWFGLLFG